MDFDVFWGSMFHVFCDLFENVSIYGIELWLQPGLDPEDSAPQKSLMFQLFFS